MNCESSLSLLSEGQVFNRIAYLDEHGKHAYTNLKAPLSPRAGLFHRKSEYLDGELEQSRRREGLALKTDSSSLKDICGDLNSGTHGCLPNDPSVSVEASQPEISDRSSTAPLFEERSYTAGNIDTKDKIAQSKNESCKYVSLVNGEVTLRGSDGIAFLYDRPMSCVQHIHTLRYKTNGRNASDEELNCLSALVCSQKRMPKLANIHICRNVGFDRLSLLDLLPTGLKHLILEPTGNTVTRQRLWPLYAVYRLRMQRLNGVPVTKNDVNRAVSVFKPLTCLERMCRAADRTNLSDVNNLYVNDHDEEITPVEKWSTAGIFNKSSNKNCAKSRDRRTSELLKEIESITKYMSATCDVNRNIPQILASIVPDHVVLRQLLVDGQHDETRREAKILLQELTASVENHKAKEGDRLLNKKLTLGRNNSATVNSNVHLVKQRKSKHVISRRVN